MFNFSGNKGRQVLSADPTVTPQNQAEAVTATAEQNGRENPAVDARIAEIEVQRQAFSQENPDFDMKSQMQNPDFVNYVWGNNLSVKDAYFLTHREEILEQARLEGMQMLLRRKQRVPENGTAKNRPAIARKNPKDLSDKEVDTIIERAKNGETITF